MRPYHSHCTRSSNRTQLSEGVVDSVLEICLESDSKIRGIRLPRAAVRLRKRGRVHCITQRVDCLWKHIIDPLPNKQSTNRPPVAIRCHSLGLFVLRSVVLVFVVVVVVVVVVGVVVVVVVVLLLLLLIFSVDCHEQSMLKFTLPILSDGERVSPSEWMWLASNPGNGSLVVCQCVLHIS